MKLSYEKTREELDASMREDVKRQLAPKRPPPELQIDPVKKKRFLENLKRPPPVLLSDYDRSITKSHEETVKKPRKSGNKVP